MRVAKQSKCETLSGDRRQCARRPSSEHRENTASYLPFDIRRIKSRETDASHDAVTVMRRQIASSEGRYRHSERSASSRGLLLSATDPSLIPVALQSVMRPFPIILFADTTDYITAAVAAAAAVAASVSRLLRRTFSAQLP